jgi:D-beta-D-heptose 7-phosphate kinase/D-beta-D-heptose 1-phosphate adenosyltransferase
MTAHMIPLLDKMAGHRIMVVGDVMLDRYVYGQVERISPEAPIPVLRTQREAMTLGGAGNVARNIVALGGEVDFIGIIGQDPAGYDVMRQIDTLPAIHPYLLTDSKRATTVKTRYVANGQQLLRADQEVTHAISADTELDILRRVEGAMDGCGVIILSDYAKGVLSPHVVASIIALAKAKKIIVLIDPKGRDFSTYKGATLLTPNRKELSEVSGSAIRNVQDAEKAARNLVATHNLDGVLAKLGSDGVCLVMRDKDAQHFHATAKEVFDVSGAGDSVLAALALALAGGLSYPDAAAISNMAGSIVVGKIGTATVSRDELAQELMSDAARQGEEKIFDLTRASEQAERWRHQGLKIGFTNGCFDLLHPGHISLLRQAKAGCDKLIVGLNSDASIKRLKGDSRPVQTEMSRAAVLASLSDVDLVVVFAEDTPIELIKGTRPAVLVKGADYSVDQVVGGDLVKSWGGEVVLAKLVDGFSTTATIAKLSKVVGKA